MTSALNATIITGNGNEGILQNDMGNTLIKDSITGSIMSLNDGFVPLGIKEYGGILYIASYNPKTKEGELGSIPSPIIHYTINGLFNESGATQISDLNPTGNENVSVEQRLNTDTLYVLSNFTFHCGDKFMVRLNLDIWDNISNYRRLNPESSENEHYPCLTSYTGEKHQNLLKGWFRVELYAVLETGSEIRLGGLESAQRYYTPDGIQGCSNYWFLTSDDNVDEVLTRTNDMYRTYPNIPSGRLAIKFVPEYPSQLDYVYNESYGANLPCVYSYENTSGNTYSTRKFVLVPGLTYTADCPIRPDKIKIECNNGLTVVNNEIIVGSGPNFPSETSFGDDHNPNEVPHSERIYGDPRANDSTSANALAYAYIHQLKDGDTYTNNFVITKYERDTYIEDPVQNSNPEDHDGLFWVEIPDWNVDIQFTLYLYTKSVQNSNEYVLYSVQTMPVFNPALVEAGDGQVLTSEEVPQYFDITGLDKNAEFDLPLFENSENKCFLYGGENNVLYDYDSSAKRYLPIKRIVDGKETKETVSFEELADLKTYIYPQTVKAIFEEEQSGSIKYGANGLRFLWNSIAHAYRYIPNEEFFNAIKKKDSNNNPIDTEYPNGADPTSEAYYKQKVLLKDAEWEWFVVSPTIPKMTVSNGGEPKQINCVLPLCYRQEGSWLDLWNDDYQTQEGGEPCDEQDANLLIAAKAQRNYFSAKQNIAGLYITGDTSLKKYTLYETNILNGTLNFTQRGDAPFTGDRGLDALGAPQNGDYTESMFYEGGSDPGKIFFYMSDGMDGQYNIIQDKDDAYQGLSDQRLPYFINNFKNEEGKNDYRGTWKKGKEEVDSMAEASFYNWSPTKAKDYASGDACPGSYLANNNCVYQKKSIGQRCIHDSYFGHLVDLNYDAIIESDSLKNKYLLGRFSKSYGGNDWLYEPSGEDSFRKDLIHLITAKTIKDPKNNNDAAETRWYASGFITEAMKKCPGYVSADTEPHKVFNFEILNTAWPINYLYTNGVSIKFENSGSDVVLKAPIIDQVSTTANYTAAMIDRQWISNKISWAEQRVIESTIIRNKKIETISPLARGSWTYDQIFNGWWKAGSGGDIELNPEDKDYKFIWRLKVGSGDQRGDQLELLLRDIYSVVATPQLTVYKDDSITRSNLSDYSLVPYIKFANENLGICGADNSLRITSSNIEQENLLDGKLPAFDKSPITLPYRYTTTFEDRKLYYGLYDNPLRVRQTVDLTEGLYVFCIAANSKVIPKILLKVNGTEYVSKFDSYASGQYYHFIPLYLKTVGTYKLTDITLTDVSQLPGGYLRNFGLYRVEIEGVSKPAKNITNALADLTGDSGTPFTGFITTSLGSDAQKVIDNLIFPAICCFKEQIYKETILQNGSGQPSSSAGTTAAVSGNAYQGNSSLALPATSGQSPQPVGCLDLTYNGFEYVDDDPRYERVCLYCVDGTNLTNGTVISYGRFGDKIIQLQPFENFTNGIRKLNN